MRYDITVPLQLLLVRRRAIAAWNSRYFNLLLTKTFSHYRSVLLDNLFESNVWFNILKRKGVVRASYKWKSYGYCHKCSTVGTCKHLEAK